MLTWISTLSGSLDRGYAWHTNTGRRSCTWARFRPDYRSDQLFMLSADKFRLGTLLAAISKGCSRSRLAPVDGYRCRGISSEKGSGKKPSGLREKASFTSMSAQQFEMNPSPALMDATLAQNLGLLPARTVLLTNDDGVGSALIKELAKRLLSLGLDIVIVAPEEDQSACGQKLNMRTPLRLLQHEDISVEDRRAKVFSVAGSPSDCVIAAVEPSTGILHKLGKTASFVVSGINLGPNLGSDILYSGTFAAARQAGIYGIPALATSLASYEKPDEQMISNVLEATEKMVSLIVPSIPHPLPNQNREKLEFLLHHSVDLEPESDDDAYRLLADGFWHGDLVLNLNTPKAWNKSFKTCRLGAVFYRNVLNIASSNEDDMGSHVVIGGGQILPVTGIANSDVDAVESGAASISTISCWPESHPFQVSARAMKYSMISSDLGIPGWLIAMRQKARENIEK